MNQTWSADVVRPGLVAPDKRVEEVNPLAFFLL
jgi:hypothetical protein